MNWTKEDIVFILKAFDESSSVDFVMESDGMKLALKKPGAAEGRKNTQTIPAEENAAEDGKAGTAGKETPAAAQNGYVIRAALAGIFYRASSPDAEPYVKEGSRVKKGDVIGLMEAMKVMSEITSPVDGIVRSIRAKNGVFTEFHSELMVIEVA